jgi:nucleotide-binding universal stress UspA family protein
MFKHILVPTDGSELSHAAAEKAVALAKLTGAQLTAFHVAPAYHFELREGQVPHDFQAPAEYAAEVAKQVRPHLDDVKQLASAAGVTCDAHYAMSDYPADAIVEAVERYGCDAVVMGSHGRKGINKLLLGSETEKVLVATKVPVVVTH